MNLNEFVEQFLPDFDEKLNKHLKKEKSYSPEFRMSFLQSISEDEEGNYFHESLQNFLDKACEKQRENCLTACPVEMDIRYYYDIKNAKKPTIEEL